MTRNEILENLCKYDKRSPDFISPSWAGYNLNKRCTCPNCTSGKTKMAVAMLKMINCTNCRNYSRARICTKCDNYSNWELKK